MKLIVLSLARAHTYTFNSDEGDTSSSSSSDNELNLNYDDLEGFCCQPVPLVPPPSPVSPTKGKQNRKVKDTFK